MGKTNTVYYVKINLEVPIWLSFQGSTSSLLEWLNFIGF